MNSRLDTVLIVDDQPDNLAILGDLLEPHYHVRVANSGERALRSAALVPRPDLILLDVMMPDLNGYAVLARLREDAATKDIPVIFVTSRDAIEDEERGITLGAVDYIAKPIKPLVTLARVRTHLANKRAKAWLADQNKYFEAEVARRMHENEIVQNACLAALGALAEIRDTETGNHIYRTRGYVEVLAKKLATHPDFADELHPEQISRLVKAAPLHDLGKVGIPDSILRKPGRLTPEEFDVMRTHTNIGSDAISSAVSKVTGSEDRNIQGNAHPLAFLEVARCIARSHHERWDGNGYPDGTAGRATPLPARIMALADVFDALISRRVYKEPMSLDAATEIIVAGRAQHFDPDIVDAFLSERGQFASIAERFADPILEMPA